MNFKNLKIKIFADGANIEEMVRLNSLDYIKGFTTNPSLMKQSGIKDYKKFALQILSKIKSKPISFEVFSDDMNEMVNQAIKIADWGTNIFVKIPITNTKGESCLNIIKKLSHLDIKLNITAIMTEEQIKNTCKALSPNVNSIISVFAGRVADTGIDPTKIISKSKKYIKNKKKHEILWASTREIFNIFQATKCGCRIITIPHELLNKVNLIGKNLNKYSIKTVKQFYTDAKKSGFNI
jgi:transaldolase